jgi:hypothetical protein
MGRVVVVLSVIVVLGGCAAVQESASPPTRLETELKRTRLVILSRPDLATVESDMTAAAAELEATTRRREELVKQVIQPARRPDLDETVTSGLQGRNVDRALSR